MAWTNTLIFIDGFLIHYRLNCRGGWFGCLLYFHNYERITALAHSVLSSFLRGVYKFFHELTECVFLQSLVKASFCRKLFIHYWSVPVVSNSSILCSLNALPALENCKILPSIFLIVKCSTYYRSGLRFYLSCSRFVMAMYFWFNCPC